MNREEAEALWGRLETALVDVQRLIVEIITERAWEPLGYESFAEAWADRLTGVRLTTEESRACVVYQLLDEGMDIPKIRDITGAQIGDAALNSLSRQRSSGVPARFASTRVRSHDRAFPSPASSITVPLTTDEVSRFRDLSEALGRRVQDEAAKALRSYFSRLEKSCRGRVSA